MSSYPTNIGCAPKNISLWFVVKNIFKGVRHMGEIPARGMHNALRFPRSPRGVQQEQQLLRVHWFSWTNGIRGFHEFVIPMVASSLHRNFVSASFHHHNMLNGARKFHCVICLRLQRENFTSTPTTVCGNEHLCFSIIYSVGKRLRRKTTEDHAMCCTNSSTCQHGNCSFRNHRQVDVYPVAFFYS